MVKYVPQEILPGDLLAGARFNVQTSTCLDEAQATVYLAVNRGERTVSARRHLIFHNHGYGNAGCTSGHLIPDYPRVLEGRVYGYP
jgi:trans-4-hydroxy-L-proline dehydratase